MASFSFPTAYGKHYDIELYANHTSPIYIKTLYGVTHPLIQIGDCGNTGSTPKADVFSIMVYLFGFEVAYTLIRDGFSVISKCTGFTVAETLAQYTMIAADGGYEINYTSFPQMLLSNMS